MLKNLRNVMEEKIKTEVKHYSTDLDYDIKEILSLNCKEYIWITRKCGTFNFPLNRILYKNDYANYVIKYYSNTSEITKAYYLKINKISKQNAEFFGEIFEIDMKKLADYIGKEEIEYQRVLMSVKTTYKIIPVLLLTPGEYDNIRETIKKKTKEDLEECNILGYLPKKVIDIKSFFIHRKDKAAISKTEEIENENVEEIN